MGMDQGKLFIGGISWDTNEDGLRKHFGLFGEVVETVIMKDRNTGRARGFGFVVFSDPAVADTVVMEKHTIDGRVVDVKKAVPRDDQQVLNRSINNSIHGSLSPGHTKKIFVGGLPSTITENDFRMYFDQFGTITDVVVMYDHNTQRPRGFGFITYDSEEAVDKVLLNTFHNLNGKKVEVKRAVPKELSPGPSTRLQSVGFNYGVNRGNTFLSGYAQGYNPSSISGYGMRMDSRLGALSTGRNGLPSLGPGFGIGLDYNPTLNSGIVGNTDVGNILNYGRSFNSFYSGGNSSRYDGPIPYSGLNRNTSTLRSSMAQTLLGNTGLNYSVNSSTAGASLTSGSGGLGSFSNSSLNWGSSLPNTLQFGGSRSGYGSGNVSYMDTDNIALGGNNFERRVSPPVAGTNLTSLNSGYEVSFEDLYGGNLVYGDPTWRPSLSDVDDTGPFSYRLGNSDADSGKEFADYIGGYNVNNRQTD